MKRKIVYSLFVSFLVSCFQQLSAQDAAGVKVIVEERTHPLIWILLAIMFGLLIAIFVLSKLYLKVVTKNISKITMLLLPMLFLGGSMFAQDAAAAPFKTEVMYQPISAMTAWLFAAGIGFEVLVIVFFGMKLSGFLRKIEVIDADKPLGAIMTMPKFWDNINASVAIEKEKDIQMDHEYDGIHELDNNLPPWWKYSFYVSIVWSILYLGYYHLGDGELSIPAYEREMELAKIEKAEIAKTMASKVDESNVTMADASGIADGATIYKSNCAACHGNAGEGNVGPNLTDKFWLHGGDMTSIYKTVKVGWPAKGMKSWEAELSPVQMKNVASYIKSLAGTNPANAKAPQGEEFIEGATAGADSTKAVVDTATAVVDTTAKDLAKK
ncbi:MAG: c-type cytochrome [Chitinophagales bacterium]|nr:c-type cytochrome [Chitinophagales bacterium]